MFLKKILGIIAVSAFFASCSEESELTENRQLEKQLSGEWESVSIKLTMNSFNNRDTVRIFEVEEKDWESKMNIRPISTTYKDDGTYISHHRNLSDKIIYEPAGIWMILGDTLITRDTFPEKALAYKYKIVFKDDKAELSGTEDCDRDGNADDHYQGILHRKK